MGPVYFKRLRVLTYVPRCVCVCYGRVVTPAKHSEIVRKPCFRTLTMAPRDAY